MRWRKTILIVLAIALIAPLSACGKRGNLEEPKDEKYQFPRKYPR
jgi:predicted small lipoprotein YifL